MYAAPKPHCNHLRPQTRSLRTRQVGTVSEVGGAQHFRGSTEGRPIGTEALELPPGIRTGVVGSFSMTVANAGDGGVFLGMGTAPKGEPISQIPVEVNSTVAVLHTASRKLHVGGVESIRHEGPDRLPAGTYHFYKYENAVREPHVPGKMSVKSIIGSTLIAVLPESVPGSRLVLVGTSSKVLHSSIRGVAATIGDEDEVHVGGQVKKVEVSPTTHVSAACTSLPTAQLQPPHKTTFRGFQPRPVQPHFADDEMSTRCRSTRTSRWTISSSGR